MKNNFNNSQNPVFKIPQLGFGTWQIEKEKTRQAVETAIDIGYRHIDTAEGYGNLEEVGEAVLSSNISRQDVFITTKVWVEDFKSKETVIGAGKRFLDKLKMDYQDLILIHWPLRTGFNVNLILEAMEELKSEGLVKNIGVSNFSIKQMKAVFKSKIEIVTNQIELHPSLYPKKLVQYCEDRKVAITGYMPLAWAQDIHLPLIVELAKKYGKSPAQICIAWQLNKGFIVIPRSTSRDHMKDNYLAQQLFLEDDDISRIDNLGLNNRLLDKKFLAENVPGVAFDWFFDQED